MASELRELRDAILSVYNDPEDCEECYALDECADEGYSSPCTVHRSNRLYHALMAVDELLGPCVCVHKRSEHHDEDTTRCKVCDCHGFKLPELTS